MVAEGVHNISAPPERAGGSLQPQNVSQGLRVSFCRSKQYSPHLSDAARLFVGKGRLELPSLAALVPKTSVYTNSTTCPSAAQYSTLHTKSIYFLLILFYTSFHYRP